MKAALLAEALLERQPWAVRQRLARSEAFGRSLGLRTYQIIEVSGIRMYQKDLFRAARKVSTEHPNVRVQVLNEGKATVKRVGSQVLLKIQQGETLSEASLDFLGLFAEEPTQRTSTLNRLLNKIGPTLDLTDLRQAAQDRPLSDDEVGIILEGLTHGVAAIQGRLEGDLRVGRAQLADIVPESFEYFERFCGPDPGEIRGCLINV